MATSRIQLRESTWLILSSMLMFSSGFSREDLPGHLRWHPKICLILFMPNLKDGTASRAVFCYLYFLCNALSSGQEAEFPEIWHLCRADITKIAMDIATIEVAVSIAPKSYCEATLTSMNNPAQSTSQNLLVKQS